MSESAEKSLAVKKVELSIVVFSLRRYKCRFLRRLRKASEIVSRGEQRTELLPQQFWGECGVVVALL